eukprot:gene8734-1567_t
MLAPRHASAVSTSEIATNPIPGATQKDLGGITWDSTEGVARSDAAAYLERHGVIAYIKDVLTLVVENNPADPVETGAFSSRLSPWAGPCHASASATRFTSPVEQYFADLSQESPANAQAARFLRLAMSCSVPREHLVPAFKLLASPTGVLGSAALLTALRLAYGHHADPLQTNSQGLPGTLPSDDPLAGTYLSYNEFECVVIQTIARVQACQAQERVSDLADLGVIFSFYQQDDGKVHLQSHQYSVWVQYSYSVQSLTVAQYSTLMTHHPSLSGPCKHGLLILIFPD